MNNRPGDAANSSMKDGKQYSRAAAGTLQTEFEDRDDPVNPNNMRDDEDDE